MQFYIVLIILGSKEEKHNSTISPGMNAWIKQDNLNNNNICLILNYNMLVIIHCKRNR